MMQVTRLVIVLTLGLLVPVSSDAGVDDIRRDALKGDTSAQYEMGILYEFGFHLVEHETEALAWYSVAAERGNEPAAQRRDLLNARLSAAQRSKADARRRELLAGMPAALPPAESTAPVTQAPPSPTPVLAAPAEPERTAPPAEVPVPAPAAEPPPAEPAPKP